MSNERISSISEIREFSTSKVTIRETTWSSEDCELEINIEGNVKRVPVFNLRNDNHKESIAKALISTKPGVVFGVGNYGFSVGIDHPRRDKYPDSWQEFWNFKPDRPLDAHVPIILPIKYWTAIVDINKILTPFRPMFTRERLEKLYEEAVICHIVAPTYDYAPHINHPALITTRDGKKSVSAFWWDDPDMNEIADLAMRYSPNILIGITSFNDHGELPAFNYGEVIDYVLQKERIPFEFIVKDPVGESVGVRSSHPQFRVPEVGEDPVWTIVRKGSRSVEKFLEATGLPFAAIGEDIAPFAPRDHPEDVSLDNLVDLVHKLSVEDFQRRRKK